MRPPQSFGQSPDSGDTPFLGTRQFGFVSNRVQTADTQEAGPLELEKSAFWGDHTLPESAIHLGLQGTDSTHLVEGTRGPSGCTHCRSHSVAGVTLGCLECFLVTSVLGEPR